MDSVSNWTPQQVVDWMKGEVIEYLSHLFTGERLAAVDSPAEGVRMDGYWSFCCAPAPNITSPLGLHTLFFMLKSGAIVNSFSLITLKDIFIPKD